MNVFSSVGKIIGHAVALIGLIALVGCLEVKQSVKIDRTGAGAVGLRIVVDKDWAPLVMPELRKTLQKDLSGEEWVMKEVQESNGNPAIDIHGKFSDVSVLRDGHSSTKFVVTKNNLFREDYHYEVQYVESVSRDFPIPYEYTVTMPGEITETNGEKLSSDTVKWRSDKGFKKGAVLSVTSSAVPLSGLAMSSAVIVALFGIGGFFFYRQRKASKSLANSEFTSADRDMVFCTECGAKNEVNSKYCTVCGFKLWIE